VSDTLPGTAMQDFLPSSLNQWVVSEETHIYSGREIFRYMDGAGEIYLAYDFQSLIAQRYARPGQEEILVEIFDMGQPRNAFGVFTYMRGRGPTVPIGQEGEYKSGLLCFWRNQYFVCVQIARENEEAKKTVLELGEKIAAAVGVDGEPPEILRFVPDEECLPGTVRYFTRHEILNIHYYVADGNPFRLNGKTECLLARMRRDRAYLLLINYSTEAEADSALGEFASAYMPEAPEQKVVRTENGKWTACARYGDYICAIFDAATNMQAAEYLDMVKGRLP
jgi:hypothetical protein